jgi:predicted nucleic acid-binding protein
MAVAEWVLVDTCIWVPFFNRPQSREKRALDELLDDDRAALIGPVLTEILLGFRRDKQTDWVASELRGLHYVPVTWNDWRAAAKLGRGLVATGHVLPQTDLVLATVALAHNYEVFTNDPHFDLISDLRRFSATVG